jgi:hypothetical protein
MSISIRIQGRRIYIAGETYPVKDQIRAIGAKWDADHKMWWVGLTARAEAEQLAARLNAAPAKASRAAAPARKPSPAKVEGEFSVSRPSRDRHDRYEVGACIFFGKINGGCYGTIIEAGKSKDDDDDQWMCWARVRPATEDELAPVRARREAAASKKADAERLKAIHQQVRRQSFDGPRPEGRTIVIETQPMGPQTIYIVSGETVYAKHPGYHDDWRETVGQVTDAALASEIVALADRLGL